MILLLIITFLLTVLFCLLIDTLATMPQYYWLYCGEGCPIIEDIHGGPWEWIDMQGTEISWKPQKSVMSILSFQWKRGGRRRDRNRQRRFDSDKMSKNRQATCSRGRILQTCFLGFFERQRDWWKQQQQHRGEQPTTQRPCCQWWAPIIIISTYRESGESTLSHKYRAEYLNKFHREFFVYLAVSFYRKHLLLLGKEEIRVSWCRSLGAAFLPHPVVRKSPANLHYRPSACWYDPS